MLSGTTKEINELNTTCRIIVWLSFRLNWTAGKTYTVAYFWLNGNRIKAIKRVMNSMDCIYPKPRISRAARCRRIIKERLAKFGHKKRQQKLLQDRMCVLLGNLNMRLSKLEEKDCKPARPQQEDVAIIDWVEELAQRWERRAAAMGNRAAASGMIECVLQQSFRERAEELRRACGESPSSEKLSDRP